MSPRHILSLFAGLALVIATAAAGVYWFSYKGPASLVDKGMESLDDVLKIGGKVVDHLGRITRFQPKLVIGGKTVIESNQQIAELAVTRKSFSQSYRWEHSFVGSTKRMEIKGTFVAKAGYVLKSPMELRFPEDGASVTMVLPDPSILSNEMTRYDIIKDEDGLWNRLNTSDREHAVNALKHAADQFVRESGILQETDDAMMAHLRKAVAEASDTPVEISREKPGLP